MDTFLYTHVFRDSDRKLIKNITVDLHIPIMSDIAVEVHINNIYAMAGVSDLDIV